MRLSVCIPAYNAERTLATTLDSVLAQDIDAEIVVLDNASTDSTGDIARACHDPRVRVLRNDRVLPIGANWDRVIRESTGELVKVVCADDVLYPGALTAQTAVFEHDPSTTLCAGRFDVIGEQGESLETGLGLPGLIGRHSSRDLARVIVRCGPAEFGPTAAAMFRRADYDAVGGLRGDLVFPMDVDLFARVGSRGDFTGLDRVVAAWRNSSFNLCSRTSTRSKIVEQLRFHHRLGADHPDLVHAADVLAGDLRLVRAVGERVRVRARAVVGR